MGHKLDGVSHHNTSSAVMSRLSWKTTLLTLICLIFLMIGPFGFLLFCADFSLRPLAPQPLAPLSAEHDGLVVLTGGEERITVALQLLHDNPSLPLLISGVNPHAQMQLLIASQTPRFNPILRQHITLGRRAISTVGNARETMQWAQQHNIQRVILITSSYHMRRSLLEFHYLAPTLTMIPYPVWSTSFTHFWSPHTWGILIREYTKLLGALLRNQFHTPKRPYDLIP